MFKVQRGITFCGFGKFNKFKTFNGLIFQLVQPLKHLKPLKHSDKFNGLIFQLVQPLKHLKPPNPF